jgi:RNA polymerase sigma-70 factor (ECF subfamily)
MRSMKGRTMTDETEGIEPAFVAASCPPRTSELPVDLAAIFEQHAAQLARGLVAAGYPDAADAVQEAFVQAVVHWRRVSRYDEPLVWIRRVAINKARNRQRARRRQLALAERLGRHPQRGGDSAELPDDEIVAAVAALPPQQRLAVSLFYLCDMSVAQVAEAMNLSDGAVKYHLHTARTAIAHSLESSDDVG